MRRALVTGGTRGIGLAISRRLAGAGYDVTMTYAHDETAARDAEAAGHDAGLPLTAARCDVRSRADWQRLFARGSPLGDDGVTVLVHAAGFVRDGLLMTMPEADFADVLGVHLTGGFLAAQTTMRGMIAQRTGRILFITSPTAHLGRRGQTSYGAAKAGLAGLMRSLVQEVSRFQITVNCVCAGLVETALTSGLSVAVRADLLGQIPLGRAGTAEEIAAAVGWLVSDGACYVTGQTIGVDGGLTASR